MKQLFFVRHAKSDWANPDLRDHDRPLNARGHREAPLKAELLRSLGFRPDALVSSTAKRAHTTAQYFAQVFAIADSAIDLRRDIYDALETDVLTVIHSLDDTLNTVFIFGHNPTMTNLANFFPHDNQPYLDNLPTSGVFHVQVDIEHWSDLSSANGRRVMIW